MERLPDLPFCDTCCGVLLFQRWEQYLRVSTILRLKCCSIVSNLCIKHQDPQVSNLFRAFSNQVGDSDEQSVVEKLQKKSTNLELVCMSCLNSVRQSVLNQIFESIIKELDILDPSAKLVTIDFQIPAILDATRIAARFIIKDYERANPKISTLLERALYHKLHAKRGIRHHRDAAIKVTVKIDVHEQMSVALALFPDFREKRQKKRVFADISTESSALSADGGLNSSLEEISQSNIGRSNG